MINRTAISGLVWLFFILVFGVAAPSCNSVPAGSTVVESTEYAEGMEFSIMERGNIRATRRSDNERWFASFDKDQNLIWKKDLYDKEVSEPPTVSGVVTEPCRKLHDLAWQRAQLWR